MVAHDEPGTHGPSDRFAYERLTPDQRAWLAALPATQVVAADALFLCHGIPTDDRLYLLETPEHGRLRLAHPDQVARRLGDVAATIYHALGIPLDTRVPDMQNRPHSVLDDGAVIPGVFA